MPVMTDDVFLFQLYLTWNLISFKITLCYVTVTCHIWKSLNISHWNIKFNNLLSLLWFEKSWLANVNVRNHGWVDWYISAHPASRAPHRITDTDCLALQQYWIFYTFLDYINFVFSSILKFQTPISSRGTLRRLRVGRSFSVPISLIPSRLKVELTSLVDIGD